MTAMIIKNLMAEYVLFVVRISSRLLDSKTNIVAYQRRYCALANVLRVYNRLILDTPRRISDAISRVLTQTTSLLSWYVVVSFAPRRPEVRCTWRQHTTVGRTATKWSPSGERRRNWRVSRPLLAHARCNSCSCGSVHRRCLCSWCGVDSTLETVCR